jgi:hypothetical protein
MPITYDELNDTKKKIVTDLLSKREAVESLLADIQTERAMADTIRTQKEQQLKTEQNRITEEVRKLRKATLT